MKIDTVLHADPVNVADQARSLADLGFDGVFTFEGVGDVFLPLALAAAATDLTIYSNLAIAFPRSPMHTAYTAWDLQKLSRGQFLLGLGTQVKANIERRFSAEWSHPVERMAEYIQALKAIFRCWQDGERLDFRGEFYTFTLMQPTFNPGPNPFGPPPVLVGALGPKVTRAVAAIADGLVLHPFMSERFLQEHTLVNVEAGLQGAGRARDGFSIVATSIVCTGRDDAEMQTAVAGTRSLLAFTGSTPAYRPVLDAHGWGDLQPELNTLSKQGRWDEMSTLIDDEVLDTLAVRGEPAAIAGEILRRYGAVADRVGFYTPYLIDPSAIVEVRAGFG
ncbi:MAG: TIGR03617 family F420-dependent LLM class oxidoreductase [Acidimicrobiales bacterium]